VPKGKRPRLAGEQICGLEIPPAEWPSSGRLSSSYLGALRFTGLDLRAAAVAVVADYLDVVAEANEVAGAPDPTPDATA
jgi:hypothetical protein